MATLAASRIESANVKFLAPPRHKAALIALFLVLALSGAIFQRQSHTHPGMLQQHPHLTPLYLFLIAMEWGLFVYVWKGGLSRTGARLSKLIGGRWTSARHVLVDTAMALGIWGIWKLFEITQVCWLGFGHAASIQTLLPRTALEVLHWIAVSISAGIC